MVVPTSTVPIKITVPFFSCSYSSSDSPTWDIIQSTPVDQAITQAHVDLLSVPFEKLGLDIDPKWQGRDNQWKPKNFLLVGSQEGIILRNADYVDSDDNDGSEDSDDDDQVDS